MSTGAIRYAMEVTLEGSAKVGSGATRRQRPREKRDGLIVPKPLPDVAARKTRFVRSESGELFKVAEASAEGNRTGMQACLNGKRPRWRRLGLEELLSGDTCEWTGVQGLKGWKGAVAKACAGQHARRR